MSGEGHQLRAAIWEAPLVTVALRCVEDRRTRSEILWTTALTELEEDILGERESDLLYYPSSDGLGIGVYQLSRDAMADAMGEWERHSRHGEPRPTMDSYLGQCLYALWYWEAWEETRTTDDEDGPSEVHFSIWIPSLHNAGPGWRDAPPRSYLERWSHFWNSGVRWGMPEKHRLYRSLLWRW